MKYVYVIQCGDERSEGMSEPEIALRSLATAKLAVFKLYSDAGKIRCITRTTWQASRNGFDYVQITKVRLL